MKRAAAFVVVGVVSLAAGFGISQLGSAGRTSSLDTSRASTTSSTTTSSTTTTTTTATTTTTTTVPETPTPNLSPPEPPGGVAQPEPPPADPPPPPPPPPPPSANWAVELLALVNTARAENGAGPLVFCGSLNRAAQNYSAVLADWGQISHTGPDGSSVVDRVQAAGYLGWTAVGENLASGQQDVNEVMRDWMNSPGHRANILNPVYTHIGLGRTDRDYGSWIAPFWVQNFGTGGSC